MNPVKVAWNVCKKVDQVTQPFDNPEVWRKVGIGIGIAAVAGATADWAHNAILDRIEERQTELDATTPEQQ